MSETLKPTRRDFIATMAAGGVAQGLGCAPAATPATRPASTPLKPIAQAVSARENHWVGDGFAVSTLFSPRIIDAQVLSPFILMDHAAPRRFEPTTTPRGVGEHPHRGFETVTFAYQGEVDHRDSHGGGGTIGAGDVQWMTAASGVVHEEKHSRSFSQNGGVFEMVQLWVNLPARMKMSSPRYQSLQGTTFPALEFGDASGRLIAGGLQGETGPAQTYSPITIFDMDLPAGSEASFEPPAGHTTLVLILEGRATAQNERSVESGDLLVMDRDAPGSVTLNAAERTRVLVLGGEPLGEPVVAQGPFVMNTQAEIHQAIRDYRAGHMGTLAPTT
jgi:redox-sensitive bicupin YhaK (pirin superfamily)